MWLQKFNIERQSHEKYYPNIRTSFSTVLYLVSDSRPNYSVHIERALEGNCCRCGTTGFCRKGVPALADTFSTLNVFVTLIMMHY